MHDVASFQRLHLVSFTVFAFFPTKVICVYNRAEYIEWVIYGTLRHTTAESQMGCARF